MSNKPIDMYKIRQLLRLYASGRGTKFISNTTGIARNTVKKYLIQFVSLKCTMTEIEAMTDAQLACTFLIRKPVVETARITDLALLLPVLAARLKKRGINKKIIYQEYIIQHPDGFKHSAFLERLNAFMGMSKPSMRVVHKAGDKLFIDYR